MFSHYFTILDMNIVFSLLSNLKTGCIRPLTPIKVNIGAMQK